MTAPDHDAVRRFATLSIEQQAILLGRSPLDWAGDLAERLGRLDALRDQLAEITAQRDKWWLVLCEASDELGGPTPEKAPYVPAWIRKLNEALATVRQHAGRSADALRECHKLLGFEPGALLPVRVPEQVQSLVNDLKAAAEGLPVRQCPTCGHPQVDYDGFGVLACTRDPQCYCTHPGSTDGVCDICGEKDSDG